MINRWFIIYLFTFIYEIYRIVFSVLRCSFSCFQCLLQPKHLQIWRTACCSGLSYLFSSNNFSIKISMQLLLPVKKTAIVDIGDIFINIFSFPLSFFLNLHEFRFSGFVRSRAWNLPVTTLKAAGVFIGKTQRKADKMNYELCFLTMQYWVLIR